MDVVVVGPCGAGKTTLAAALRGAGYTVRAVAQEHSIIRDLWQHGGEAAALIFLDAAPDVISIRRGHDFPLWLYHEQLQRLKDAREHATLVLDTTVLSSAEVRAAVLAHLQTRGV
ncbi:MAG: AAA family ATPase [Herpetosiphonaceae bacterium]|nr:AAA family ATPase [Herpetosiphonaceae bacterium]